MTIYVCFGCDGISRRRGGTARDCYVVVPWRPHRSPCYPFRHREPFRPERRVSRPRIRTERRLREAVAALYDLDGEAASDAAMDRLSAPYDPLGGYWAHYIRVWAERAGPP